MVHKKVWHALSALARIPQQGPVVSIVCLHQVVPEFDPLRPGEPDGEEFEKLVGGLKSRFDMISLRDVPGYLEGRRHGHAVVLTFDDGYKNNYSIARPILKRLNVPATFFIATGFLNRGCMWNDLVIESVRHLDGLAFEWDECKISHTATDSDSGRLTLVGKILGALKYCDPVKREKLAEALADRAGLMQAPALMMTEAEVVDMDSDGNFELGAHTDRHPILAAVSDAEAAAEIATGKAKLESLLGRSVDLFAYPNGRPGEDYRAAHVRMVQDAGFSMAVTTSMGAVTSAATPLQMPRQSIWRREPLYAALSLLRGSRQLGQSLETDTLG
jgi:peptidoglycan/xylan/chitin deacetylase (PgdA/CDA1 family)